MNYCDPEVNAVPFHCRNYDAEAEAQRIHNLGLFHYFKEIDPDHADDDAHRIHELGIFRPKKA